MLKVIFHILIVISFIPSCICSQDSVTYSQWIIDYNSSLLSENLASHYHAKAYVDYTDKIEGGNEKIINQIKDIRKITGSITTIAISGQTIGKSGNKMVIGKMYTENGDFAILSSFKRMNSKMLKEFEIIRPLISVNTNVDPVLNQRKAWEKHSNSHSPDFLVSEVYASNSYYLNQGKLINGRQKIIEEYSYMKGNNWHINLYKSYLLQVNEGLIFEIGTYQSNGKGQYLLIWELSPADRWEITLDSNF